MKRLFSIIMAVALCVCTLVIPASAAGGQISVSSATAERGEQVTINISLSGAEFAYLKLRVTYDKDALKIVNCVGAIDGLAFTQGNPDNPTYAPVWQGAANASPNGVIASITFKVSDTAAKGLHPITVEAVECYNQDYDDVAITGSSSNINVTVTPCTTHTWDAGTVTQSKDCENDELTKFTCTVCDATETRTTAKATGHDWGEWTVTTPATCEGKGVETRVCGNNGEHKETREVNALGHDWNDGEVTKAPTCTDKGVKTFTCQNDSSHTKTEEVAALDHNWDAGKVTTNPTCTDKGVKTFTCQNDSSHTKTEEVAALGHDWNDGEVTKAPTCTEKGVKTFTCKNDPTHTETEEIAALGHNWGPWTENTVTGKHERSCTNSGCTEKQEGEHNWDKGQVTTPATCVADGVKTFACKDCKAIKTGVVPATGEHVFTDSYDHDENGHQGICACGLHDNNVSKHSFSINGDVLVKPTTTKEGKQEMLCVCGEKTVVTLEKIPAEYDDVHKTGDITGQIVLYTSAVIALMAGAAYVLKRRFAR